jgi:hypothetical protein
MAKWADYGITAVRYNSQETHIDQVKARKSNGETFGQELIYTRQSVIDALKQGYTFVTVNNGTNGKLTRGEDVRIVKINGVEYIRTDANNIAKDNLGNLPRF